MHVYSRLLLQTHYSGFIVVLVVSRTGCVSRCSCLGFVGVVVVVFRCFLPFALTLRASARNGSVRHGTTTKKTTTTTTTRTTTKTTTRNQRLENSKTKRERKKRERQTRHREPQAKQETKTTKIDEEDQVEGKQILALVPVQRACTAHCVKRIEAKRRTRRKSKKSTKAV